MSNMGANSKDEMLLKRHFEDIACRAKERFCPQFTSFLDEGQRGIAKNVCKMYSQDLFCVDFGGYDDAERRIVGYFPKDIYADCGNLCELYEMFDMKILKISGSGYSSFTHRDCMGAILALRIDRKTMGDIVVLDDGVCAYVFLLPTAFQYVLENLTSVGRENVTCCEIDFCDLPHIKRKFEVVSGTVASFRLDCIVALCTGTSREKAKTMILGGQVQLNHLEELRTNVEIAEGDVLSVRGFGRFVVAQQGGVTKKGRNRLVIHKMI